MVFNLHHAGLGTSTSSRFLLISFSFCPFPVTNNWSLHCTYGLLVGDVQMAESEVPVYTTNEHFQGMDARNAEQTRAEMVSHSQSTCTEL